MSRSSVFQKPQLGVETVYGTEVDATKWLQATSVRMRPNIPTDDFRPTGMRFPTDTIPQKGQGTFNFEGRLNQGGDLVYVLSSLLMKVAVAGTWVFEPPTGNPPADGVVSYTMETGSSQGAEQLLGALFDSVEFTWNRTTSMMRGTGFGKTLVPGITITAAPTGVTKALGLHGKVEVKVGDSIGGLTKLTRCLEVSHFIRGTQHGLFTLDDAEEGFSDVVYAAPEVGGRLVVENNSVAAGYLADLKAAKQKFIQITHFGPVGIGVGGLERYRSVHVFPFKFKGEDTGDDQDVETGIFDLLPVHNEAYGKACSITVYNAMATL